MMRRILTSILMVVVALAASAESISVSCRLGTSDRLLTLGTPAVYTLSVSASSGVKSVKVSGLPKGLKYDKKQGKIVGSATKEGNYTISVTVTTKGRAKEVRSLGTVKVPGLSSIAYGNFKGMIYHNGKPGILTMKITNKGKTSGKLVFGDKSSLVVKSGWYTDALEGYAGFQLNFKDGSTQTLIFYDLADTGHPLYVGHLGCFMQPERGSLNVFQDIFSDKTYKAALKKLLGKKHVYQNPNGLTYTISPNGSVTVKGTYNGMMVNTKTSLVVGWYQSGYNIFVCYCPMPNNTNYRCDFGVSNSGEWYDNIK